MHPVPTPGAAAPLFPSVRASNLNRRTFTLPTGFEGERNLVILAFQREQQALVDSWMTTVDELLERHPDLSFYELPTISRGNPLFRAWLDGAMRGGIPDGAARERTITLYLDKAEFRRTLDLPHEQTIYVLLLDRAGHVLWRGQGAYTDHLGHELEEVLAKPPSVSNDPLHRL